MDFSAILYLNLGVLVVNLLLAILSLPPLFSISRLINRTALFHPSLKFILISEFANMGIFALNRIFQILAILPSLTSGRMPFTDQFGISIAITYASTRFSVFFSLALVAERLLATLKAKTYEGRKGWKFSIVWFILAVSFPQKKVN